MCCSSVTGCCVVPKVRCVRGTAVMLRPGTRHVEEGSVPRRAKSIREEVTGISAGLRKQNGHAAKPQNMLQQEMSLCSGVVQREGGAK